jgi:hypothetical protein
MNELALIQSKGDEGGWCTSLSRELQRVVPLSFVSPADLHDRLGRWQPVSATIPVTAGQVTPFRQRRSSGHSEVRWQDFRGTRCPHMSPLPGYSKTRVARSISPRLCLTLSEARASGC